MYEYQLKLTNTENKINFHNIFLRNLSDASEETGNKHPSFAMH